MEIGGPNRSQERYLFCAKFDIGHGTTVQCGKNNLQCGKKNQQSVIKKLLLTSHVMVELPPKKTHTTQTVCRGIPRGQEWLHPWRNKKEVFKSLHAVLSSALYLLRGESPCCHKKNSRISFLLLLLPPLHPPYCSDCSDWPFQQLLVLLLNSMTS